jgi:IS1 family transposase
LINPFNRENGYADGNYAYYYRFSSEVLTVTKKHWQKIERKHLSLRIWSAWLVRKCIRYSKIEQMRKIVVGITINVWFLGGYDLCNNFRTSPQSE